MCQRHLDESLECDSADGTDVPSGVSRKDYEKSVV